MGIGALAVYFLFVYFGDEGRGTLAPAAVGCIAGTVWICWPLRREWWFWVTIGAVVAIHVLAGVAFDWSAAAQWNGLTLMPLMLLDFAIVLTTIYCLYRLIYGRPAKLVIESEV